MEDVEYWSNKKVNTNKENEENGRSIDPSPLNSPFIMSPAMVGAPQSPHGILKPNNPYIPYQKNNQGQHKQFPFKA